jgi:hypothetical protein
VAFPHPRLDSGVVPTFRSTFAIHDSIIVVVIDSIGIPPKTGSSWARMIDW